MPVQYIHGVCPHDCPDACGIITEVENGQAINFYADTDHPITKGWLCVKVRSYLNHVYHPNRLKYPLRRVGQKGSGNWQQITWAEALSEIATRWIETITHYGSEAILPYSYSGTLGLVQMGVANTRFWNRLGASQLERSICGAAAEMAVEATLGARHAPAYESVTDSQLIIIWGHNPVSTAPHFMPYLQAAKRQGCEVIVIDPRRTRTARTASLHLAPLPGTDGALALGLANIIVSNGWHNQAWLKTNTVGWPQFQAMLSQYSLDHVAEITGLSASSIYNLAQRYATTHPSLIKIADGLQRHQNGGQTVRAICALPALTAQYGVHGGGLFYSSSGYFGWDDETMNYWSQCPPPGRMVNMNRLGAALLGEVTNPPIKSLYVFGANPAAISPNPAKIKQGLAQEDLFTVVHELFMTDTADMADIVLPATSQLEQTDFNRGYGHTYLTYNEKAIAAVGESKSNWEVMGLLAKAMGFTEPWLQETPDQIIEALLTKTALYKPMLQDITLNRLKEEKTIFLAPNPTIPFADLHFPTPSGKIELYAQALADQGLDPLPEWQPITDKQAIPIDLPPESLPPLTLITGAAHHFVSSTFANNSALLKRENTPFVEINPTDATARGINNGDLVQIENARGWCKLRAVVTDAIRPGVLASPKGRWTKLDPWQNGNGGRNVNWTTPDTLGDMGGQSTFHSNWVWIKTTNSEQ